MFQYAFRRQAAVWQFDSSQQKACAKYCKCTGMQDEEDQRRHPARPGSKASDHTDPGQARHTVATGYCRLLQAAFTLYTTVLSTGHLARACAATLEPQSNIFKDLAAASSCLTLALTVILKSKMNGPGSEARVCGEARTFTAGLNM